MSDRGLGYGEFRRGWPVVLVASPLGLGWDYDVHGSYPLALKIRCFILLAGAASLLALGRYRHFTDEEIRA